MNFDFLAYLSFTLVCSVFMWVAFRPAWHEWRHPTDSKPLPIFPNYTSDIDHFAARFREIAMAKIAGDRLAENDLFKFVTADHEKMDWAGAKQPLIAFNSIKTNRPIQCEQPLFVNGDIDSCAGDHFTALFAQGAIRLAANSQITEWAHAEDGVVLGAACIAPRRTSSAAIVELDDGCCFERVTAPVVRFGGKQNSVATQEIEPIKANLINAKFINLEGAQRRTDALYRIEGDCELLEGHRYVGSLIVTGHLHIGHGAEVVGDVKARKSITVGFGAVVIGALTSEGKIQILDDAHVLGPVISESLILVGAQARIGTLNTPTTLSAENIIAESSAIAHGTVWARDLGMVWSG